MDLELFGRVLWRSRGVVAAGFLLAVLLAILSIARISLNGGIPQATYRSGEVWQNNTTVLLTQRGFPEGRSTFPARPGFPYADPGRFSYLADLYSQLASGDAVLALLRKSGPVDGTVEAATVLTSTNSSTPLISIYAKSPTKRAATLLARRATTALIRYIDLRQKSAGIPRTQRVELRVVRGADSAVLISPRSKTLPIIVFLAVMIAVFALAFLIENRRRIVPAAVPVETLPRESPTAQSRFPATDRIERSASP